MYFIFLVVVVFSLSGCHNALLGLFNDWMNAINPKLPFVRQSNIIAYGWFDKGAAFNWVKHYGSIPLLWPLDGEVVHVHGLAHGKLFTSDFPLAEGHYIPLDISMNTQHDTLQKPSENMFSSVQASCDIHEM